MYQGAPLPPPPFSNLSLLKHSVGQGFWKITKAYRGGGRQEVRKCSFICMPRNLGICGELAQIFERVVGRSWQCVGEGSKQLQALCLTAL